MIALTGLLLCVSSCTTQPVEEKTLSGLNPADFRTEVNGKQTDLFVLKTRTVWRCVSPTTAVALCR